MFRQYLYELATDKKKDFLSGCVKSLLFLFSLVYGLFSAILRSFLLWQAKRLKVKVISVGNITLGGTGKTPLVENIARFLKEKGHKVAVISRGYGRRRRLPLQTAANTFDNVGDEPFMLSAKLPGIPVITDSNRIRAARVAVRKYGVDTVVLDDGFQQWGIKKDIEIVTIDSTCPFGNSFLLPRGILREPLSSLARADIFVITKCNLSRDQEELINRLHSYNGAAAVFKSRHMPVNFYKAQDNKTVMGSDSFKDKTVGIVSGIADPDSFRSLLCDCGLNIGLSFVFPDHHDYSKEDISRIIKECSREGVDTLITTEKDSARLGSYMDFLEHNLIKLLVLRLKLELENDEKEFHNRLLGIYPA